MKAIQLEKPQSFRRIEIPEPPEPGPGEALVRIHRIGICGTDFGGYLGKMPFFSYPRIPGHDLGVEVLAVGEGVTNVKPGDRCAVEPYLNCQKCYSCHRGHTNCCENHKTLGVMCDGGMCERMILPARKLHVSRELTFEQLALVETLAIGCHAINRADAKPLNELTNGQLADVVVDATGSNISMSRALNYCAFAGRLVYVGITPELVSFPHAPVLHRRELTILASRNALAPDFIRIIRLIEDGEIDTRPWITHHADFDGMIAEFPNWLKPETGVIKAMVEVE